MKQRLSSSERRAIVLERLKDRLPSLVSEAAWAAGDAAIPDPNLPPRWVRLAIQRMVQEIPLGLGHSTGSSGVTPDIRGKIAGFVGAGSLSVMFPSEEENALEENNPQLKRLRELFIPLAAKMKATESELTRAHPEFGTPKTPKEMENYYKGGQEAAAFVSGEAELSLTGNLCFWMWILWPDIEELRSRTKVHEWFADMGFVSCSFKLFEKVCKEIGYRPGG